MVFSYFTFLLGKEKAVGRLTIPRKLHNFLSNLSLGFLATKFLIKNQAF